MLGEGGVQGTGAASPDSSCAAGLQAFTAGYLECCRGIGQEGAFLSGCPRLRAKGTVPARPRGKDSTQ